MTTRSNELYTSLSAPYITQPPIKNPAGEMPYIQKLLESSLPHSNKMEIEHELRREILLLKRVSRYHDDIKRKPRHKKTFLTRKQRDSLDILRLSKREWSYESLEDMRSMWLEYMNENLQIICGGKTGRVPPLLSNEWCHFAGVLARSELIGGSVEVVRSKTPSIVGLKGTVVMETKMTFQIVGEDSKLKIIGKNCSVFVFHVGTLKITVFGKHLMTRPNERSVKKIKGHIMPDL